jgi:NAD(P)-dependent dehydrogenase (short-subunit alcohol dehydrogenase family)
LLQFLFFTFLLLSFSFLSPAFPSLILFHFFFPTSHRPQEANSRSDRLISIVIDVSNTDSVSSGISQIVQKFGGLDAVVNNAARVPDLEHVTSCQDLSLDDWNSFLGTNLTGPFLTTKYAIPYLSSPSSSSSASSLPAFLLDQRKGRIINIASTRALQSEAHTEGYSTTKGGLISLTHSLSVSLASKNILVNSVSPGWIHTTEPEEGEVDVGVETYEKLGSLAHSQHPAGRVGVPDDIAVMVGFLLLDQTSFITGQNFTVDGGMTKKMIYLE